MYIQNGNKSLFLKKFQDNILVENDDFLFVY